MEKIYLEFGESLKTHLEQRNKAQKDLADYLGVSEGTVSNWISGRKMPRMNKIDKICEYLNIGRTELLGITQDDIAKDSLAYLYSTLAEKEGISVKALMKAVEFAKSLDA